MVGHWAPEIQIGSLRKHVADHSTVDPRLLLDRLGEEGHREGLLNDIRELARVGPDSVSLGLSANVRRDLPALP